MKRKYSDLEINQLKINKPHFLLCEICNNKVFNYELCSSPYIYCSNDCLEVLILSHKNSYMDCDDSKMKRIKSEDNISCGSWDSNDKYADVIKDLVNAMKE